MDERRSQSHNATEYRREVKYWLASKFVWQNSSNKDTDQDTKEIYRFGQLGQRWYSTNQVELRENHKKNRVIFSIKLQHIQSRYSGNCYSILNNVLEK